MRPNTVRMLLAIIVCCVISPTCLQAQNDAASLYKSKCMMCHGPDGSGNTPSGKALKAKDLRMDDTQKKSDADITAVITNGRNKMPAFGQKLKADQIQQLVSYIRQLKK